MIIPASENKRGPKYKQGDSYSLMYSLVAYTFIVIQLVLIFANLGTLESPIPIHFNAAGEPDNSGSKFSLFMVPAINLLTIIFMRYLVRFDQFHNYPVKVTANNREIQKKLMLQFIYALSASLSLMFLFIVHFMIQSAKSGTVVGSNIILAIIGCLIVVPTLVYIYLARKNS